MKKHVMRRTAFGLVIAAAVYAAGHLLQAEPPQPVGTWASMGAAAQGRSAAAAVTLPDGRTLLTGGQLSDGSLTNSVVIYDPLTNSFTGAGALVAPRVGHTATLLKDGHVLITGGTVDGVISSDVELFDPTTQTSALVALMTQPRTGHAAARLADDTILIVGGSTIDNGILQSAEIFNPATGGTTPIAGSLLQPRTSASATTLIDGRVLVVGGSNGTDNLATAEVFEPITQTFSLADTQLSVARRGHTAILLPHNNGVLIAGGIAGTLADGAAVTTADLFLPAEFPDPYSYGLGRFAPTGPLTTARARAAGGPAGDNGYAYVLGGGSASAEAYRFATIKTDKDDYAPGEHAIITGSGWEPNKTVHLVFQEDPAVHLDYMLDVTADGEGNIFDDTWAPEHHDIGVRFYLLASDSKSRAQITFTDSPKVGAVTVGAQTPNPVGAPGSATYSITVDRGTGSGSSGAIDTTLSLTTALPTGASASFSAGLLATCASGGQKTCFDPPNSIRFASGDNSLTASMTISTTAATPGGSTSFTVRAATSATDFADGNGSLSVDATAPSVTINQASGQADPTNASPILFTAIFSETVTGFTASDVSFAGSTVGGTLVASISGVGPTYTVSVTGMTGTGAVVASIPAAAVTDSAGNANTASTSTDNSVTFDNVAPTVTINQASGQADPTNASPILFTAIFSETVTGFTASDVSFAGSTVGGSLVASISGAGPTYTVSVTGMTGTGMVVASIPAAAVTDSAGNANTASTSTDNSVTFDNVAPTVTINQASGQNDPTNASPILFTVVFSEAVTGFTASDVSFAGSTVGGTLVASVSGPGPTYTVSVTGMTGTGTVVASILAGAASDGVGNGNSASTSTDNSVTFDNVAPTVTINQASGQNDPTNASPILFTVVFSEAVTGFDATDVSLAGSTVGGTLVASVSGTGPTYTVSVTGMNGTGTVVASIPAAAATDPAGNASAASTSTDNSVTFDNVPPTVTINQAAGQSDPTNASPILFTVAFSEAVTGFDASDVAFAGSTVGGTLAASISGTGPTYTVSVTGMNGTGTVVASIPAAAATDPAGNASAASTSTDNTVTFDNVPPTVTINQAAGQNDPTNASPILFTVAFSEAVTGFDATDVSLAGSTVGGTLVASVSGTGPTYTVSVTGMNGVGTVVASIPAGGVTDLAGNANTASTSTDKTVTFDNILPTITITTPPNGGSYVLNQSVLANYSCDPTGTSLVSCTGPVPNGSAINTASVGGKTFAVNAQDAAGNTSSKTNNYSVRNGVCLLYDPTKAHKKGSTVPVKLFLCDSAGNNVSSAATVLNATTVEKIDTSASALVEDSGNANPDANFRFDLSLAPGGGYIFNVSTKPAGYSMGTWRLSFTVNGVGDPNYFVTFDIR